MPALNIAFETASAADTGIDANLAEISGAQDKSTLMTKVRSGLKLMGLSALLAAAPASAQQAPATVTLASADTTPETPAFDLDAWAEEGDEADAKELAEEKAQTAEEKAQTAQKTEELEAEKAQTAQKTAQLETEKAQTAEEKAQTAAKTAQLENATAEADQATAEANDARQVREALDKIAQQAPATVTLASADTTPETPAFDLDAWAEEGDEADAKELAVKTAQLETEKAQTAAKTAELENATAEANQATAEANDARQVREALDKIAQAESPKE